MTNVPVVQLQACEYSNLSKCSPVWNKSTIPYYVYISVDPAIMRECALYQVDEITPEGSSPANCHAIFRDVNCWLRATTGLLNTAAGHHIYKLSFVRRRDNVVFSLYIAYYVQDDNPDKPYIYMHRENSCGGTNEENICSKTI